MALGQGARPLEGEERNKVTVEDEGSRRSIATHDERVLMALESMAQDIKKVRLLLEILAEEEIGDVA